MDYEQISDNLEELLAFTETQRLHLGEDLQDHVDRVNEFIDDRQEMNNDELFIKWDQRFKEFFQSIFVVVRLTFSVLPLKTHSGLRSVLKDILKGDLTQQSKQDPGKDKLFELEVGSLLEASGFDVALDEPDLVISGNGLSAPFGIACKYPSSEKQIHAHLNKGYKQITQKRLDGCVGIGMDQLVFDGFGSYIDFRQTQTPPQELMQRELDIRITTLTRERSEKYPSEHPMDTGMMFLCAGGVYGNPPLALVRVTSLAVTSKSSPSYPSMRIIHEALRRMT